MTDPREETDSTPNETELEPIDSVEETDEVDGDEEEGDADDR